MLRFAYSLKSFNNIICSYSLFLKIYYLNFMIKNINAQVKSFPIYSICSIDFFLNKKSYLSKRLKNKRLNNSFNNRLSTTTRALSFQAEKGGEKKEQALKKEKESYLILPDLRIDQDIKDLLKVVNFDIGYFYSCYAFSVTLCCIMAQIRSRALTTGKSLQEIQKFDSLRFYSKALASHIKPLLVAEIFSLDKLLPFLSTEEATPIKLKSILNSLSIPDHKATVKMSRDTIMASYTNKIAYGRGLFRSYIGKMQTTSIFSLENFEKYNELTISNLKNVIQGGESMYLESLIESIQELFHNETIFRDNINLNLNHNQNLVPLEKSLNLKIIRKNNLINILHDTDLDEHEKNISLIEKIRRKRIKELNKSLFITEKK